MDREIFERRIDELEVHKVQLRAKIDELEKEYTETHGAIREMWRWWETAKNDGEFGSVRYDGRTKIHILPKFGSPSAIEEGLKTRLDAQIEGDAEIAKAARIDRGKQDAQKAVDQIHGWNEGQTDDNDWRRQEPQAPSEPEPPDDLWTKFRE